MVDGTPEGEADEVLSLNGPDLLADQLRRVEQVVEDRRAAKKALFDAMPSRTRHRITEIDADARTGVCSQCGPGEIKRRYSGGRGSGWACAEKQRRATRAANRRKSYGITQAGYDQLRDAQDGRCQICAASFGDALVVDHDHKTGRIRGLLCRACNSGIGFLRDDPTNLRSAIEYLASA